MIRVCISKSESKSTIIALELLSKLNSSIDYLVTSTMDDNEDIISRCAQRFNKFRFNVVTTRVIITLITTEH